MKALRVLAGPRARTVLRERGLRAADVRMVPAAAGGPKGLALLPLDRFVFGHWLPGAAPTVHLIGASIGAWRMAAACMADADAALAQLGELYITQRYDTAPGQRPTPAQVSQGFGALLAQSLVAEQVLATPHYRLHVLTSRSAWRSPWALGGAALANVVARRAMGAWLTRVVFGDARDPLPLALRDYRTRQVALSAANLLPAVLASCSIPTWMLGVPTPPGAPRGTYWDGGIVDYHLHLPYAQLGDGLVLYPHTQTRVIPGWLDQRLPHRHRPTPALANLVLLAPREDWVASLPGGKLPDRQDFVTHLHEPAVRIARWRAAVAECQRLADEFAALTQAASVQAEPLP